MKLATFAVAALLAINGAMATPEAVVPTKTMTSVDAFEAAKGLELPTGVTLTGAVDPISEPKKGELATTTGDDKDHDNKEWFSGGYGGFGYGGWGGIGGWGGWGGWGGLGPYRFGFSCGGLGGWAYPLGYWNAFGAGLYGGGCGLGIPFGGLFYC